MRVYIAGPMTGVMMHNWPSFAEAKLRWQDAGHDPVTPPDINNMVYQRHYGRDFRPESDPFAYGDPLSNEMYGEDQLALAKADAIALLPGWQRSAGAKHELKTAFLLKLRIFDAVTMLEIPSGSRNHLEEVFS